MKVVISWLLPTYSTASSPKPTGFGTQEQWALSQIVPSPLPFSMLQVFGEIGLLPIEVLNVVNLSIDKTCWRVKPLNLLLDFGALLILVFF